jgi:hypothetical protein
MDMQTIAIYAGAAILLLLVLSAIISLFRGRSSSVRARKGQRLGVIEYLDLDGIRRLVLIRRDAVEHLLLTGPNQDVVVESGIGAAEARIPLDDDAPLLRRPQHLEPAAENSERGQSPAPARPRMAPPRPAVFGDRAPNLRSLEPDGPRLTSIRGDYEQSEP